MSGLTAREREQVREASSQGGYVPAQWVLYLLQELEAAETEISRLQGGDAS